jgi:hypothetical protein
MTVRLLSESEYLDMSRTFVVFFVLALLFVSFLAITTADPVGPDGVTVQSNETKTAPSAAVLNISGGRIATINITSRTQNPRWKGFLGQVSGSFTLDDAGGSTLFNWTLTTVGGEVYATRNSTTISWTNIKCANVTLLEYENVQMNHTSSQDNITRTFNSSTHASFVVGTTTISANSCPSLNTFIGNATQDTDFEEIVLTDSTSAGLANGTLVYSTIMESDVNGFDSLPYDFQMIVPEIGYAGFTGSTAYYLYVELS